MGYLNAFQLISTECAKANIPFLVVGGFAVNYYKVSRTTKDIDFLIQEEDYTRLLPVLENEGYKEMMKGPLVARLQNERPFFMMIDFLFTDQQTLEKMIRDSREGLVRGQNFKMPSLRHLLSMKLHALKQGKGERDYKDLLDILELVNRNGVDAYSDDFRNLCLQYADENVLRKILDLCPKKKS